MSNVVIKNCNNIKEASITIEQSNLNIKFAINGTGKSTIAKALLNKEKDLSLLKPFGKEEIPYVECNQKFNNVELFDSDFVNNVVFNGSNVIENAFEVFNNALAIVDLPVATPPSIAIMYFCSFLVINYLFSLYFCSKI